MAVRLARATQTDFPTKVRLAYEALGALDFFQSKATPSQNDKLKCHSNQTQDCRSPG